MDQPLSNYIFVYLLSPGCSATTATTNSLVFVFNTGVALTSCLNRIASKVAEVQQPVAFTMAAKFTMDRKSVLPPHCIVLKISLHTPLNVPLPLNKVFWNPIST